jgi:UDP-glucose 4-epimerase/UDP-glucuronate decarboxylase
VSARHLVTGAAGLVGFELVRQLLAAGEAVVAVDRAQPDDLRELARAAGERLELVRIDLAHPGAGAALPAERFGAIHHAAALLGVAFVAAEPWETLATNLASTLAVLEHARSHGCDAFVFTSSSEVYASGVQSGALPLPTPADVPVGIADVALPRWSYAASKIAGECATFAASAGFRPVIARLHNVYGPRMQPTHVIPAMLARCRAGEDPFAVYGARQTRAFLHVADAARALCVLAAAPDARGIYHVGSDRETRIADLARMALAVSGHRAALVERDPPAGSVDRRVPEVAPLRALGFEPRVALEDGLAACWRALLARPEAAGGHALRDADSAEVGPEDAAPGV